ncbi:PaaI family thioesterase [Nocardioides sp. LHG3406-4]|uniref:PaaI family thioesterase n=1 Tax=Nocardioides sp. LHG3406-4 TaxID=2804575 RepID=UPI003CEA137D
MSSEAAPVTVSAPPVLPSVPIILGAPERLFGLTELVVKADGSIAGTMPTGPWLSGPDGRGEVAGLGLLIDDVLGYAAVQLADGWALSTEVSVDMVGTVPVDGSRVHCVARVVHEDTTGPLVSGEVLHDDGQVLAHCTLRGRLVGTYPTPALSPDRLLLPSPAVAADLDALLGDDFVPGQDGARVTVGSGFANPLGNLHGGMAFCFLERVAARAMPAPGRTASVRMQLVRAAPVGSVLHLEAVRVHRGRTLGVVQVVSRDEAGRVGAIATVTRH